LAALKSLLIERQRRLSAVIDMHLHLDGSLGAPGAIVDADDSIRTSETDFALAEVERETAEQTAVVQALDRIVEGSYGVCLECGEPIGFERLLAHPTAMRCLGCQRAREAAHR